MNGQISNSDIETYRQMILDEQLILQQMIDDPNISIINVYNRTTDFTIVLDEATSDWMGLQVCLSGLQYSPETDEDGSISHIATKNSSVRLALYNGVLGMFYNTISGAFITDHEELEETPRDNLKILIGYHAVTAMRTTSLYDANHFYSEETVARWCAFFPAEQSSISFTNSFARDHEIIFPDPDADDPAKILIDAGVYEASKRKNINYLLKVLKKELNEKTPLEKELYITYLNKLLANEKVCLEEVYANKAYYEHVDGGYEQIQETKAEDSVSKITPSTTTPLNFAILGADGDPGEQEIALSLELDDYDVLLPVGSIMNCKLTTTKQ